MTQRTESKARGNLSQRAGLSPGKGTGDVCLAGLQNCHGLISDGCVSLVFPLFEQECLYSLPHACFTIMCVLVGERGAYN